MKNAEIFTQKSVAQLLDLLPLAHAFNPLQREIVASHLKAYRLPANTFLLEENKPNDYLYFLCEGSLNVVKESASQHPKILHTLTAGQIAGEASFFDHTLCSASLIANEETIVLVLDRMQFIKLSDESPHSALALALELFKLLTRRLRQTSAKLVDLL